MTHRRHFIKQSLALGAGVSSLSHFASAASSDPRFTIALSQYSLRQFFFDKTLDPLDFPKYTAETLGIKAIDLWEGGLPKDKINNQGYLENLRKKSEAAKTHLFLLMTGKLDASPKKVDASIKRLLPSIQRASTLGCTYLRVFLGAPGKDEASAIDPCVEGLKKLADHAAEKNITIAIEPGGSVLSQRGAFLTKVVQKIKHPSLCLMPDFGKLKNNIYEGTQAMLPYTKTISAKMHSFDDQNLQPDFDYNKLMKMIVASDYHGYLAIEFEGKRLDPKSGVLASKALIEKSLALQGITLN